MKDNLFDELFDAITSFTGMEQAVRPSCAAASFSLSRARSLSLCLRQVANIETFVRTENEENKDSSFKDIEKGNERWVKELKSAEERKAGANPEAK